MDSKQDQTKHPDKVTNCKTRRKVIDLQTKQKVIKMYESGKGVNLISRELGMARSTVGGIVKNKEKFTEAVKHSSSLKITQVREGLVSEMEKTLGTWIEDQASKYIILSPNEIMAKALSLFEMLKQKAGPKSEVEFCASLGWFRRFKKRFPIHNLKISDRTVNFDENTVKGFITSLDSVIAREGYLPQQIFNIDETTLFWKRVPERNLIDKEAKTSKDKITILLGGNVSGYKLKPFVIWCKENPGAFRRINYHTLPVHYRSDENSLMNQQLFQDAIINCCATEIEKYCSKENVPFKILLIVDNDLKHSPFINDLHPNIKMLYLPLNITSLIQPMNQGVFDVFKAYYLKRYLTQTLNAMDKLQFRNNYDIHQCIENVASAWNDIPKECMNGIWKKIMKRFVLNFEEFEKDKELAKINKHVVDLASKLNLEVNEKEIAEHLEFVPDKLENEELSELEPEQECPDEEITITIEEETTKEEELTKKFTEEGLSKFFTDLNNLLKTAKDMDSNSERFTLVEQNVHSALAEYKNIYDNMKKQNEQNSNLETIVSIEDSDSSSLDCEETEIEAMEMEVYNSDSDSI